MLVGARDNADGRVVVLVVHLGRVVVQLLAGLPHGQRRELAGFVLYQNVGEQWLAAEEHIGVVAVAARGDAHVAAHEHHPAPSALPSVIS